ncbi:ABC transporter transmembrane region [Rhizoctonia solani]|uniref:ABC transporter transmembrane region n=1 Tax=Rhizoctonia solani TaxID=456999 RepID=A0A8H8PA18_9AGAM|nr:ABC transporter transmembrane region [Rhizoctonia solani]QRW27528.1 ABC transporter transmembrane region [Rhizoctonia solani]
MDQVLLWETVLMVSQPTPIWKHNLLIPIACAVLSIVLLLLHGFLSAISAKYLIAKLCGRETEGRTISVDSAPQQLVVQQHTGFFPDLYSRIRSHGGTVVFVWKVLRLMACLTLTGLTTGAIVLINEGHNTIGTKQYKPVDDPHLNSDMDILKKAQGSEHQKYTKRERWFSTAEWIEISLCMFYTYTTLLAILALTLAPRSRAAVNTHLVVLLLIAFAVYIWRDLVPFATYDLDPVDAVGGWLTWARIGVLGFASVVVPLFIPRIYVPIDPNNPSKNPNPEQTASLISLLLYSFLDPLLWTAYRAPKLEYEQLPPLADYDRASHLKERSFSKLDPLKQTKPRYFFWGLMAVFWKEYVVMAITLIIKAMMDFAGPIGIKYILRYLETPSDPGYLRPWFWILWLLIGPIFGSIAWQWYIFLKMNSVVRATGMITQLIFEHTLRIRMNAQAADEPSGKTSEPEILTAGLTVDEEDPIVTTGSDSGEPDGTNNVMDASNTQTLIGSTSSAKVRIKEGTEGEIENKGNDSLNLIGRINNLMSTDLENVTGGSYFLFVLVYAPAQFIISVVFLYNILGWSAIIGMCFMVLSFPIPGKLAQLVNDVEKKQMKKTDERVQIISETLNVIRMVKLFGWEKKVVAKVAEKRVVELEYYKRKQWIGQVGANTNFILPLLVMALTFASHTLWFKQELTASIVFSSIGVFDVLRSQLHMLAWQIPAAVQAKVSIDRIDEFLHQTELLDAYTHKHTPAIIDPSPPPPDAIGFRNATFAWSRQAPATPTPSRRNFRLHIDQELLFHRGKINMVVGPTGCGKTSLLMALLGEMHFVPSAPDSWFSLPRQGGIAYAAQEAWVQNESIRDNILLGAEYDEERYKKVISQCALERDLTLFEAGDQTEVGEKGMTLSGGQKARVSLARAIYSKADIIILDDVLSVLDVHTSRWVVDHCFRGELVAGRTMIIVTHNVAMVSEVAHFVVSLGSDGRIVSQGSIDEALRLNPKLKAEAEKDEELERKGEEVVDESNAVDKSEANAKKGDGKLMVAEEVAEGHIGWPALKFFLTVLGGFWFWVAYFLGLILANAAILGQTYWLGIWARAYKVDQGYSEYVNVPFYLGIYGFICVTGIGFFTAALVIHVLGSARASRRIHDRLIKAVLGAPLRWLDSTPVGRIIARFTQDIRCIDASLPNECRNLAELTVEELARLIGVIVFAPVFTLPGAAVFAIGLWLGQVYMTAQMSVKREMSNARSPLFSHFGAALQGITSIRAYGVEDLFKTEALKRVDKYTRSGRAFYSLNRWVCIRTDALGGLFASALATYLVYYQVSVDASDTGFSLSMAVAFSGGIIWWVRILNEFEVQGNSLERVQDYVSVEQEPESVPEKAPPAYWPASGHIVAENLTARYSKDGPAVLHGLSFEIKSGERVGVVGRTGSGKSSLTLSLLRMIPIEGNVYYDGIPTHGVNLDALRSSITIIPQQPELMSGTVRQNLDPFDEYGDAVLNAALRSAGLDTLQSEDDEGYIGLESGVSAGGGNFSLGQRQILALARAIVRRSKVLILDEATAAIDYNTDTAIQKSIRTELKDRTLIIVAHRLQTICDADKIMVLEAGKIIEFDSPAALLQKESGAFKSLVDESGDRDALYAMSKGH